jgi:hypothetical protein
MGGGRFRRLLLVWNRGGSAWADDVEEYPLGRGAFAGFDPTDPLLTPICKGEAGLKYAS